MTTHCEELPTAKHHQLQALSQREAPKLLPQSASAAINCKLPPTKCCLHTYIISLNANIQFYVTNRSIKWSIMFSEEIGGRGEISRCYVSYR